MAEYIRSEKLLDKASRMCLECDEENSERCKECLAACVLNEERKRVNIRYQTKDGIQCRCAIDNHHIDYLQCFEHWCRRWKRERKWDGDIDA